MFFLTKLCFFSFLFGIATSVMFSEKYFRELFPEKFIREREQFTADEFFKKLGLTPKIKIGGEGFKLGPLVHKAVVIDPKTLQVIHYRYKDENDTTAEERRALEAIHNNTNNAGPTNVVANLVNTIEQQLRQDFLKAKSIDDILKIRINCRGPIRNGLMELMYKYDPRNRKVYQDNMVQSIVEPCRVNNEFDTRWAPFPAEEIVRRAKSRVNLYFLN